MHVQVSWYTYLTAVIGLGMYTDLGGQFKFAGSINLHEIMYVKSEEGRQGREGKEEKRRGASRYVYKLTFLNKINFSFKNSIKLKLIVRKWIVDNRSWQTRCMFIRWVDNIYVWTIHPCIAVNSITFSSKSQKRRE